MESTTRKKKRVRGVCEEAGVFVAGAKKKGARVAGEHTHGSPYIKQRGSRTSRLHSWW
jgi:hypothetical protein